MEPTDTHTPHTKFMLFVLAIVLFGASVTGYIISQNMQNKKTASGFTRQNMSPTITPTLIPYPKNGVFTLKPSAQSMRVGETFSIDLIATSGKMPVAGYDVVLTYDKSAFNRQSVQNLEEAFRIYTYDRTADRTSISATKNIQVTAPITFADSPLLRFTFVAKKAGNFTVSLKPVGAESSKMVDDEANVTYPDLSDISLEIK